MTNPHRDALQRIETMIEAGGRPTVNDRNVWEHFLELNRLVVEIRHIARAALSSDVKPK